MAEGLRKSEALMQGHGHPGALEALGLEALEVSKREDSLVMLGYQVAPIGAAKILEEAKAGKASMMLSWLAQRVRLNCYNI